MRSLSIALACVVAALAVAQTTLTPKFTAGANSTYNYIMQLSVSGTEAEITGKLKHEVAEVKDDVVSHKFNIQDYKLTVGGTEEEIPFEPISVKTTAGSVPQEITGGITGSDPARTLLAIHFIAPSGPLTKDSAVTTKVAKSEKLGTGEIIVEHKLLGEEEMAGLKTFKIEYKLNEESTKFKVESTYWVTADCKIVKVSGKIANLPVPAIGSTADGSIKAELLP